MLWRDSSEVLTGVQCRPCEAVDDVPTWKLQTMPCEAVDEGLNGDT